MEYISIFFYCVPSFAFVFGIVEGAYFAFGGKVDAEEVGAEVAPGGCAR
jgi:hypothetical protein